MIVGWVMDGWGLTSKNLEGHCPDVDQKLVQCLHTLQDSIMAHKTDTELSLGYENWLTFS